ncbi:MAG: anti-sigma factor antagonist [Calditrichaeota bacterium]|nr:MAG: anti-sigma factor antagonist [Calditrichota bacterium]MBL1203996.1 anti-sigma factor antagonist [Calditrichota bacterium]NOG43827.1 STAS domain-containing protein [Calditrichota bacterium]
MSQVSELVVQPDYDIVTSKCDDLRDKLRKSFKDGVKQITIDLNNVNIVDSTGLSVLISAHNSLKKEGESLKLVNVSENILKLLAITRLDKHFAIQNN